MATARPERSAAGRSPLCRNHLPRRLAEADAAFEGAEAPSAERTRRACGVGATHGFAVLPGASGRSAGYDRRRMRGRRTCFSAGSSDQSPTVGSPTSCTVIDSVGQ